MIVEFYPASRGYILLSWTVARMFFRNKSRAAELTLMVISSCGDIRALTIATAPHITIYLLQIELTPSFRLSAQPSANSPPARMAHYYLVRDHWKR